MRASSIGFDTVQYAASKAAVIALTKGDSQAYAAEGIRVSFVSAMLVLRADVLTWVTSFRRSTAYVLELSLRQ